MKNLRLAAAAAIVVLGLSVACLPARDFTGVQCSSATPCPPGFTCMPAAGGLSTCKEDVGGGSGGGGSCAGCMQGGSCFVATADHCGLNGSPCTPCSGG